jgi:hypothetical protein
MPVWRAALQHADRHTLFLDETRGDDAAGGAGPHHHIVERVDGI